MPSIEDEVTKVTSDKTQEEDWTAIIVICHQITASHGNTPQNYLNVIMKRLRNPNPNVAMKAITLLDACYSNCGKKFQILLAKREFTDELRRLLGQVSQLHDRVRDRLRGLLHNWATENEHDPDMNLLCVAYHMLKRDGIKFPDAEEAGGENKPPKTTDEVAKKKEDEDMKKAIAASLKEEQRLGATAGVSSMYPAMEGLSLGGGGGGGIGTGGSVQKKGNVDRYEALYDFDAGEENELNFKSGDVIEILDNSDENWWKGQLRGKVGLFPKNFVSKHVAGQSQAKKERAKERKEKEDRGKKIDINEEKLDLTLEMLKKADAHSEASVEDKTLKELEQHCELMRPLINQKIQHYQSKYDRLMDLNVQFREAMAFYQKLLKESSDAYRHTQVIVQEQALPVYQQPSQYPPQYPPPGTQEQQPPSLIPDFNYPTYPPAPQSLQAAYPPPPTVPEQPLPFQVVPGTYPTVLPQGTPMVYPGQPYVLPAAPQGYNLPQQQL
ncbi:Signal transducing adapter molecule 2 [Oopsacas minuta]|uniref:Signal transducing adapter molecule 2 n=1 Tax=Oopsacas minuta TaxID=111878 RepID=A0AAV7K5X0_9METZ|nr:Signal transducing adapter molecule 2 [Oopsacas minuta]